MKSILERRGVVTAFPAFTGERAYMVPFLKEHGLPSELSRWQPVVDEMLRDVNVNGPMYFMADQSFVPSGQPHRRPGVHIDGYWHPLLAAHGYGGSHGSRQSPVDYESLIDVYRPRVRAPTKKSYRKNVPPPPPPVPSTPSTGVHPIKKGPTRKPRFPKVKFDGWGTAAFDEPEAILLASDVPGCRAFVGDFDGVIAHGGNCDAVPLDGLTPVMLGANHVYAGNVTMLHESVPVPHDCHRTLVRINVPGWSPGLY